MRAARGKSPTAFNRRTARSAVGGAVAAAVIIGLSATGVDTQVRQSMTTRADFLRAMEELSNWGRWGDDDELGAANLITPDKRRAAAALVTEGLSVSLAHDIIQVEAIDASSILERQAYGISPTRGYDRLAYTGSYHGTIHSHLDSIACHIMWEGRGYNGYRMEDIEAAGACPQGHINNLKDGIVDARHPVRRDAAPRKATAEGWLEPGTAVRKADLEALEELHGGARLGGRRDPALHGPLEAARRRRPVGGGPRTASPATMPTWRTSCRSAASRSSATTCRTIVEPHEFYDEVRLPLHYLALVALGVGIFDNLDFERAVETARRLDKYEFLFTASPLRIEGGMGSPLNPDSRRSDGPGGGGGAASVRGRGGGRPFRLEQRQVHRLGHHAIAVVVAVDRVAGSYAGRMRAGWSGVADGLVEFDHGVVRAAGPHPRVERLPLGLPRFE